MSPDHRLFFGTLRAAVLSLITVLLTTGCPVADPYTESRLVNSSAGPIEVQLELDAARYGAATSDSVVRNAPDWLREFAQGNGVEITELQAAALTGRYRIAAGGFMVAHASLGRKPYIRFMRLTISRDNRTLAYTGVDEITRLFRPIKGEANRYEFPVTDAMLAAVSQHLAPTACSEAGSNGVSALAGPIKDEALGALHLGLGEGRLHDIVPGVPQKGEETYWAASGEYGQKWHYPAAGLTVVMKSACAGATKTVGSVHIAAPSSLATRRGIKIGSARADVLHIYGDLGAADAEGFGEPDKTFVAGSIYGGMIFTFTDGKVSEIFLGAAAE